jgi:Matrixin
VRVSKASSRSYGVAAIFVFVAVFCFAPRAGAYCRTVTERPPMGYDPSTGCFTGSAAAKLLYWKNKCVAFSLERKASSKVTLEQATKVASDAFAAWSAATCDASGGPTIDVVDAGPVDCGLIEYNMTGPNQNVIVFHDDVWPYNDANNTLGLTTMTFDINTGEIFDADMEINATVPIVAEGPVTAGGYDLRSIITHEAGHFLGLAHTSDASAMMFALYHADAPMLTTDDTGGICTIFAPDGTRSTSAGPTSPGPCDPTARHGFSTECGSLHPNPPSNDNAPGSGGGCGIGRSSGRFGFGGAALVVLFALAMRRGRRSTAS